MRRRSTVLFPVLLLFPLPLLLGCGAAGTIQRTGASAAGLRDVAALGLADSHVEANADELLDRIGARVSAQPSGHAAQEFVRSRLSEYGVDRVQLESFPLLAWDRRDATLRVVTPAEMAGTKLNILSLGHVASHTVEAPLIDAGHGTAEEIAALGDGVAGRIVLADVGSPAGYGRGVHRTEKVTLATRAGAAGFIQLNTTPGPRIPVGVATIGDYETAIPAVAADYETGVKLRTALSAGNGPGGNDTSAEVVVRLAVDNWMERAEAANVLADIAGRSDEVVLVGAHLDSWDLAPGAVDNGSGTLAVLEAARTLAEHTRRTGQKPLRTIRFAFWMGEELGLYGSRHHVDARLASRELDRYAAVLNMDVIGAPVGLGAMGRPEAASLLQSVRSELSGVGIELETEIGTGGGLYSDHQPFLMQGMPIFTLRTRQPSRAAGVGHTTEDSRDRIDEPGIARSAIVAAALLWALANEPELGTARWSEDEIGRHLEALGVRDPLERAGEWRWN